MAQAKTSKTSSRTGGAKRSATGSRGGSQSAKAKASAARANGKRSASAKPPRGNAANGAAKEAPAPEGPGKTLADAAKQARTPLAVAGGAVAGVIGGLALRRRKSHSKPTARLAKDLLVPLRHGRLDADALARFGTRIEGFGRQLTAVSKALGSQQRKR